MTYEMFIDKQIKTWERTYVTVEADSQEEAIQKCLDDKYRIVSSRALNIAQPTGYIEIYNYKDYNPIYSNYDNT